MTKNKFAKPPYIPTFDRADAEKLRDQLMLLHRKRPFRTPEGVIEEIDKLLHRPSSIRKCDLSLMRPLVELINEINAPRGTKVKCPNIKEACDWRGTDNYCTADEIEVVVSKYDIAINCPNGEFSA